MFHLWLIALIYHLNLQGVTAFPSVNVKPFSKAITQVSVIDNARIEAISSTSDIYDAAKFMIDAFWLHSPQGLLLDDTVLLSDIDKDALIQHQFADFQEKYGERMGQRVLRTFLFRAVDSITKECLGLVGLEVSLLNTDIGDTISTTKSEDMIKRAVTSLGPKQRRQFKNASVDDIARELLSPEWKAVAILSNLVVSPSARRRGLAKALCDHVESIASGPEWRYSEMYLRVEIENLAARELYQNKLGFQQAYELSGVSGMRVHGGKFSEIPVDTLVLSKRLHND
jgi:GNAT superfamily N-acetyltransferase